MKRILFYFCVLTGPTQIVQTEDQRAVVIVPVADLVGEPLENLCNEGAASSPYHSLPWSCFRSHYDVNIRIHQLLFHEMVTILEQKGNEVLVEVPNVYFHAPDTRSQQTRYWMQKNNLIAIKALVDQKISLNLLPSHQVSKQKSHTVALIKPWHDTKTGYTFSVGTRFIMKQKKSPKQNVVYYIHPSTKTIALMAIPATHVYQLKDQSREQRIKDFVRIARLWANNGGNIPYVLGGCSYTFLLPSNQFCLKEKNLNGSRRLYYDRPMHLNKIKAGLDCSGLILRVAQIVGLPYYFKNTATLSDKIASLSRRESLSNGDLIWLPGHVILVSDVKNNLAIEAHSYDGGYGIVHEKPLHKMFSTIRTYEDLVDTYRKGAVLERLNSDNHAYLSYTRFKLLKLSSIFGLQNLANGR